MNLVDSAGWLEFLTDGPFSGNFALPLSDISRLVVPTLSMAEVFRVVLRERGEDDALQAVALMMQGQVAGLTPEISMLGPRLSLEHDLPLAAGIVLATAHIHQATLWTREALFKGVPGVKCFPGRR